MGAKPFMVSEHWINRWTLSALNSAVGCALGEATADQSLGCAIGRALRGLFNMLDRRRAAGHLLRELFKYPSKPVEFNSGWRSSTAVALTAHMYETRDFSAVPILADALQDAGCDNDAILRHCREPGEHVRGCWVVDLVLGKE